MQRSTQSCLSSPWSHLMALMEFKTNLVTNIYAVFVFKWSSYFSEVLHFLKKIQKEI